MPKPGSGLHGLTVYLVFNKAWDGDTVISKNKSHWIILIFSEMLTSVQFSLKTWHPRENWPGLELFLMLSERQRTKQKLQKFLVLMWPRKASTTSPHVLTQLPMPDAMLLWTSRPVSNLTPVIETLSTPAGPRLLEITCALRSRDGWETLLVSRLMESETWSSHFTTVPVEEHGLLFLVLEKISMQSSHCAVILMEPTSTAMNRQPTRAAKPYTYLCIVFNMKRCY